MGEQSPVDVVSIRVGDGDAVTIEGLNLTAMYTPGHTDDSYCFRMDDRVFTGDTLLIGTGQPTSRTAMPATSMTRCLAISSNSPTACWSTQRMTIRATWSPHRREKAFNPRLQAGSRDAYIELMAGMNRPIRK